MALNDTAPADLFANGGEMGEHMRRYDWNHHPLGNPEPWPLSLKTGIRIMLHSRHPVFIWWTREMYMFHNDAFVPLMGKKHPEGLGAKGYQVWAEIWPQLGSILEGILEGEEAFYGEELQVLINRRSYLDETYWTFSYSAMPDDEGKVNGIFCACNEVTDTVLAKRRIRTIKDLSEATLLRPGLEEVCQWTVQVLAENKADIPFTLLYLLDKSGREAVLAAQSGQLPHVLVPASVALTHSAESALPLLQVLQTKQPLLRELPQQMPLPELRPQRAAILPISKPGEEALSGILVVGLSQYLEYDAHYQNFHQMLTAQIATALFTVEARRQAEQERGRLESLFMEAPAPIVILEGSELIFQLVNPAYQQIFPGRQLRGKPLLEALPEVAATPIVGILQQVYQTGKTYVAQEVPLLLARNEGEQMEEIYWTFTYQARRNTQGAIDGVLVFAYEVTDQVSARKAIEASQKQFKTLSEAIPQLVWTAAPNGQVDYFNSRWYAYTGQQACQAMGEGWQEAMHPTDLPGLLQRWGEGLTTGQSCEAEARIKGVDGSYRWFLIRALPLKDQQGHIQQWFGTNTDIHDRKLAEERLHRSEERLQKALSIQTVGVIFFDLEGRITDANPAFCRMSGFVKEDFKSGRVRWDEVTPAEFMEGTLISRQELLTRGENLPYEKQYIRADGSRWWGLFAGKRLNENECIEFVLDITESKRAEAALRESEARFRLMADAVPQIVWLTDPQGRVEFFNKQWSRYTGAAYEPTTAAQVAASFVHPDEGPLTMEAFAQARQTGSIFSVEHRIRSAEGNYRWFLVRAEPYRDPDTGEILRWFGASIDIHDQKLARQALQESEERFRIMADAAPNIVWALHPDGTQKYLNKFGLQYLGVTLQEALALNWIPFIHPEDLAATSQAVSGAIEHQRPYRQEHRLRRHDGGYRWYLAQGAPSYYPSGELYGYVGSGIDITDLKEAEQRLQLLSEELAAANEELRASNQELLQANECLSRVNADLDNFIYTASHDLKAPILNIEGLLKVLSRKVQAQSGQEEQLSHILTLMENSVSRFKETINDLTDIARIQKQLDVASEPVNLREMVEVTLLDLTELVQQAGAQIENHLEEHHTVVFPRKNLKSVVYNLLSNAVKYRNPDRALLIRVSCRTEGDYLVLNVQDNGLGMNTRDSDKIFGMFKRQHTHVEGTGIGLYIVKKMVENAGGRIEVESQVGEGAAFIVYFKQ